ncbi:unnamed protein product [Nesidiocoris tenuis]|uniref:Ribosome biogenesis protein NOP53 n=1 Tax=Nesidiocoris tenuis TaxID=355587 RepID=A0A6H5HMA6_9HEMI|nr:unnamed protein product [Nesidiocoris tenuis]
MSITVERNKRKRVSKRRRKDWRKHSDIQDVDDFLNQQRQEERIGGPASAKKDEELFVIDEQTANELQHGAALSKKERARSRSLTCYKHLEPMTAVPDPIAKRNRVRTKEERESVILKNIREKKRLAGYVTKKELQSKKDREQALKKKKKQPKGTVFKEDVWNEKDEKPEWLNKDTLEHNLNKLKLVKVRTPKGVFKKKSVLPPVEVPHPGTSYNPSYEDHQDLLKAVVDKEVSLEKKEAHLTRVTSACFEKVTPAEKEARWIEEMSQGLFKEESELDVEIKEEKLSDDEDAKENLKLSINPPTDRLKAKTRKQRRIQKMLREEALKRKQVKEEKKKITDIYRLKKLHSAIEKTMEKQKIMLERRKKLAEKNIARTKRLGPREFLEPDPDFSRPCELRSSLNMIKKQGNLLADRYLSLQKRNILPPGKKNLGFVNHDCVTLIIIAVIIRF